MLQRNILDFKFASSKYNFYFYTFVTKTSITTTLSKYLSGVPVN